MSFNSQLDRNNLSEAELMDCLLAASTTEYPWNPADPETGEVIACGGKKVERTVAKLYTARTAKELCVETIEKPQPCPITMLDHAAYLGREFTRAESALVSGTEYIQD